jgi:GDP-D-mannose dehydratase
MQQPEPDDYVLATGQTSSVQSFCDLAASALDYELAWEGEGVRSHPPRIGHSQTREVHPCSQNVGLSARAEIGRRKL